MPKYTPYVIQRIFQLGIHFSKLMQRIKSDLILTIFKFLKDLDPNKEHGLKRNIKH